MEELHIVSLMIAAALIHPLISLYNHTKSIGHYWFELWNTNVITVATLILWSLCVWLFMSFVRCVPLHLVVRKAKIWNWNVLCWIQMIFSSFVIYFLLSTFNMSWRPKRFVVLAFYFASLYTVVQCCALFCQESVNSFKCALYFSPNDAFTHPVI